MVDCGWIVVFEILDSGRSSESRCTEPAISYHYWTCIQVLARYGISHQTQKTMAANGSDASHVYNSEWARVVKQQFNNIMAEGLAGLSFV